MTTTKTTKLGFTNGEKARLKNVGGGLSGFEPGDIVTIDTTYVGASDFRVNNGIVSGYTDASNLEKLSTFKVGDKVKIVKDSCMHKFPIGEVVTVVEVRVYCLRCENNEGTVRSVTEHNVEAVEETPFKVGDKVKLTIPEGKTARHGMGSVRNGDVGEVVRIRHNNELLVDFPNQEDWWGHPSEFTLHVEEPLKAGDHAKITGDGDKGPACPHNLPIGTIVEIISGVREASNGMVHIVETKEGRQKGVATADLVKAEKPVEVVAKPEFKVGDYVKVVGGKTPIQKLQKGDIARIQSEAAAYDFRVERISDGITELFDKEDLVAVEMPVEVDLEPTEIELLQKEVADLKERVAKLEGKTTVKTADEMPVYPNHPLRHETFGEVRKQMLREEQQGKRDEAIEAAKSDIKEMEAQGGWDAQYVEEGNHTYRHRIYNVKYVINQDKRTVVALVYDKRSGSLLEKGVAKCDPDDCFNAHIGKAIALKRALGLPVPSEYMDAPLPTEAKIGDAVKLKNTGCVLKPSSDSIVPMVNDQIKRGIARVIDDSRLEQE